MCRKFQLRLVGEREPILIVADTDVDAMSQMKGIKQKSGKKVASFVEVYKIPTRFKQQFNNIFAT